MYRIGFLIITALAILFGLLVGSLNSDNVTVDLLWMQLHWPLGLLLLCFMALGFLIGQLLSWIASVIPLKVQLRKLRGAEGQSPAPDSRTTPPK